MVKVPELPDLDAPQLEWDAYFSAIERNKKLRQENPYVLHLIKVLWPRGERGLRRIDVIDRIFQTRFPTGLNIPKEFEKTVQSAYNHHCWHSSVFQRRNGKPEEELFYPVGGKGSGIWAVNRERAAEWLRNHQFES
jgi:hypothetical protein